MRLRKGSSEKKDLASPWLNCQALVNWPNLFKVCAVALPLAWETWRADASLPIFLSSNVDSPATTNSSFTTTLPAHAQAQPPTPAPPTFNHLLIPASGLNCFLPFAVDLDAALGSPLLPGSPGFTSLRLFFQAPAPGKLAAATSFNHLCPFEQQSSLLPPVCQLVTSNTTRSFRQGCRLAPDALPPRTLRISRANAQPPATPAAHPKPPISGPDDTPSNNLVRRRLDRPSLDTDLVTASSSSHTAVSSNAKPCLVASSPHRRGFRRILAKCTSPQRLRIQHRDSARRPRAPASPFPGTHRGS